MVLFHILYDLNYFDVLKINFDTLFFQSYIYINATPFLLLVGVSLTLSYSKAKKTMTEKEIQKKFLVRGLKIFGYGLIITLVTWIYLPDGFIIFGILHCVGISVIFAYPFLKLQKSSLGIGFSLVIAGVFLRFFIFDFYYLLWLGFIPAGFFTVDYFPLLPWFGVVLIGIFVGKKLYPNYKRSFHLNDMSEHRSVKILSFLGRHSLIIYLIHQPIILALIWLIF